MELGSNVLLKHDEKQIPLTLKGETTSSVETNEKSCNALNNDPYAYLNRDFTSENFKIELKNLPRYYGVKEIKKLLKTKLKLNMTKIKIPSLRSSFVFICFPSENEKKQALNKLNNYEWKGCLLKAEEAKPIPDPLVQKRIQAFSVDYEENRKNKKMKFDEKGCVEQLKDSAAPLWNASYSDQLERKTQLIIRLLRQFGDQLRRTNYDLKDWWKQQTINFNGLPCELFPIRKSDIINGYRNKCEFSVGIDSETGLKTVGFRLGSYVKGSTCVGPVDDIPTVPDQMKIVVLTVQNYIRNSTYDVFCSETHKGYWRQITVRYGFRTDQLMLIIGLDPQSMTEEDLFQLKKNIKEYFTEGEGRSCNIDSLYLQQIKRKKSQCDDSEYEHIFGETCIFETILGKTFRISPQAFFQVNTYAADILYESISELACLTKNITLLDVCCGTGSIGICLAEKCGEVLGLEISPEAIADAEANIKFNNVKNVNFFAGKAEEILSCVAHKATKDEIIAIVDPPRSGLQHDALIQIRRNEKIRKLVYIACNPRGALKNFIDLGRPASKIYKGEPFLPVKAIPVDLFPYTYHCELLIYFERRSES